MYRNQRNSRVHECSCCRARQTLPYVGQPPLTNFSQSMTIMAKRVCVCVCGDVIVCVCVRVCVIVVDGLD